MPYNPAIPLATDLISDSQSDLYGNFQAIDIGTTGGAGNVGFSREHVTMTDAANGGLHVQATMKDQAAVTPSVGYGSYYASKTGTEAGIITEAVYKSGDSTAISLLSAIKAWGVFNGTTIADGFNFDSVTNPNAGQYVVNFTNALPNVNYAVLVTAQMQTNFTSGSIIGIDARAVGSFQINDRALTGAFGAGSNPISFVVIQS